MSERHHHHYPRAARFDRQAIARDFKAVEGFNAKVAVLITGAVGTMACAYVFALLACLSLPAAISSGSTIIIIAWIAQTFLQLVLLSVIMVGQRVQAFAADERVERILKLLEDRRGD